MARLVAKEILQTADTDEKRQLKEWLDASPEHAREYAELLKRLRRDLLRPEPSDAKEQWEQCRDRLPGQARRSLRRAALRRYAAVAVWLLAVALGLGGGWRWYSAHPDGTQLASIVPGSEKAVLVSADERETALTAHTPLTDKLPEVTIHNENGILRYEAPFTDTVARTVYHTLKVPRGGEYRLLLADGTRIHLNADTELTYPIALGTADTVRRVFVRGEAYFQVARHEGLPFDVHLDGGRVRVLGTAFNVHSYPEDEQKVVTLSRGAVRFIAGSGTHDLRPGQQLVFDSRTGRTELRRVDVAAYTSWIDGVFEFNSMPLGQIMQQFARWYDIDYRFEDPALANRLFTGVAYRHASLANVLRQIEKTTRIHFAIHKRTIIIHN